MRTIALPDSGLRPAPRGGFAPATPTKSKTFPTRQNMNANLSAVASLPLVGARHSLTPEHQKHLLERAGKG
jgi:hypothetical protein